MPAETFRTHSEEESIALGQRLAQTLPPGVVLLIGNLGAGKTTLSKGILSGLQAAPVEEVSSPTFTLIHEYGRALHIDLYRLETEAEVERLGWDDLLSEAEWILVEWGERFPRLMPSGRTEIRLTALHENEREITVSYP